MGDLIMSSPAIRALKESFRSKITVLTSSMAGRIAKQFSFIDEVIVSDVPWVKLKSNEGAAGFYQLVEELRRQKFDAAVIFSVFSQNPMPAIMLAYLAGIPSRLAYCRENPYDLLTEWVPDKEPFSFINHQVTRDLKLVEYVGAHTKTDELSIDVPADAYAEVHQKLLDVGVTGERSWIIVHPGASEPKREYPAERFHNTLRAIVRELDVDILLTGTASEKRITEHLRTGIETNTYSLAGMLNLEQFMALIDIAPLVLSVNTGTVHIAAALKTPVVVLYALTNPQHTPWKCPSKVFTFPVEDELQSNNEILRYVSDHVLKDCGYPCPAEVVASVKSLMRTVHQRYA